jgi:hypothetical protein
MPFLTLHCVGAPSKLIGPVYSFLETVADCAALIRPTVLGGWVGSGFSIWFMGCGDATALGPDSKKFLRSFF